MSFFYYRKTATGWRKHQRLEMENGGMEQQTIQEEEKQQQEPQKSSFLSDVAEILETVFVSIFVVILLFAYVVRPVTVDGDSMRETLHDKDRLLMSDLLYTPEYGDIVIVNNTHSYLYDEDGNLVEGNGLPQEKRLIKRIIATGGQEINIDFATGEVTVDGEVLDEPYIRELTANQETGVFGKLFFDYTNPYELPMAFRQEVKEGAAQILTTISGNTPQLFDIVIDKISFSQNNPTKNMIIRITDPVLLEKTGGIIQGMSGSPIIQDGKLVGAVTHVFVNDPTKGYGIFAENMYNQSKNVAS